jgi:hypothetical protein
MQNGQPLFKAPVSVAPFPWGTIPLRKDSGMSSEAINASAFGAAGIGMPGVMWASDKLGYEIPHWLAELVLIISALCVLVSVVLWLHLLFQTSLPSWPIFNRQIPFHVAARRVYEATEKANALDLMVSPTSKPEDKLNHFKMLLLVDDRVRLFGARPPSTKSRLIPKDELKREIYPAEGDVSQLNDLWPAEHPPAFVDVTIPRKDLRRIIKIYLDEYVREVKQLRKGKGWS